MKHNMSRSSIAFLICLFLSGCASPVSMNDELSQELPRISDTLHSYFYGLSNRLEDVLSETTYNRPVGWQYWVASYDLQDYSISGVSIVGSISTDRTPVTFWLTFSAYENRKSVKGDAKYTAIMKKNNGKWQIEWGSMKPVNNSPPEWEIVNWSINGTKPSAVSLKRGSSFSFSITVHNKGGQSWSDVGTQLCDDLNSIDYSTEPLFIGEGRTMTSERTAQVSTMLSKGTLKFTVWTKADSTGSKYGPISVSIPYTTY